jgi:hypothetical protein
MQILEEQRLERVVSLIRCESDAIELQFGRPRQDDDGTVTIDRVTLEGVDDLIDIDDSLEPDHRGAIPSRRNRAPRPDHEVATKFGGWCERPGDIHGPVVLRGYDNRKGIAGIGCTDYFQLLPTTSDCFRLAATTGDVGSRAIVDNRR